MHGLVVRNTGSWYEVRTDEGALLPCKVKGNFRLRGIRSTNPVAVGDYVTLADGNRASEGGEEFAWITDIDERRNYIIRKASNLSKQSHILAANIDLALLVVTVARPETLLTFIDRFLASAEAYRIPVVIVLNKEDDLRTAEETEKAEYWQLLYEQVGYPVVRLSAKQNTDALLPYIEGKTVLLAGNSGVGKSTILNALIPGAKARTANVSDAHGTGMHTTTLSELYECRTAEHNYQLIDVPGIKGFGTFDMEREELGHYFRDIFALSEECRFSNCTHTHEPGCAVFDALEEHRLAPSRYSSYLSMLEDKDENKYREKL